MLHKNIISILQIKFSLFYTILAKLIQMFTRHMSVEEKVLTWKQYFISYVFKVLLTFRYCRMPCKQFENMLRSHSCLFQAKKQRVSNKSSLCRGMFSNVTGNQETYLRHRAIQTKYFIHIKETI